MSRSLARKGLSTLLALAVAAVAILVALDAPAPRRAPAFALTAAGGALALESDRAGAAILQAGNLRPGDEIAGEVTLSAARDVTLALRGTTTASALAGRLTLAIDDVSDPAAPVAVHRGMLAGLSQLRLAPLAGGVRRTYRFTTSFPPGANDNALQGATLTARFDWIAVGADGAPAAPPTTPAGPPPPASAPGPAAPVASPAAARLVGLPSARRCVKRKRYRLKAKPAPGVRVTSVSAYVDKHRQRGRRRGRKAILDLRTARRARTSVRVVVGTSAGRVTITAKYRLCAR